MKRVFETAFTKYTETKIIGAGGTSQVLEVVDDDENQYALKLLNLANTTKGEVVKRFKNEIHFCSQHVHKNVIAVLDSGVFFYNDGRFPFYVMPRYNSSLRNLIKTKIDEELILLFFNQMLDGLESAHLLGVIHRDIKPENILFDFTKNILAIADFGIAAFQEEQLYTLVETKDGTRLANFQYASPEQRMRGKKVDHRSDIYSLGLILNEMVTGELAIGTSYKEIAAVYNSLSYLDPIVTKMISQDPNDRYPSIVEIKKELLGRAAEYTQLQRLNESKNKVIKFTEIDNPLALAPNKIINVDWKNNVLEFHLEKSVDQKWITAFQNMGNYEYLVGKDPQRFVIRENKATITATENEVQQIVQYFKAWLPVAHNKYVSTIQTEKRQEEARIIAEQKLNIEQEEARLRVLKNIKF